METNFKKTEQLILYIATHLKEAKSYGSVLLNKALYYIDNMHYLKHGKPVSAFKYIKQDLGPTPNSREFMSLQSEMINNGMIRLEEHENLGRVQKKLIPLRNPDLNFFDPNELKIMNEICAIFIESTGCEISEMSHEELGWIFARPMEEIPFSAFLLTNDPEITEEDYLWAEQIISLRN